MQKHSFRAPLRDPMVVIVAGWQLACGMVVHRSLLDGGQQDDHWTVSDPITGASVARGHTMAEAVLAYRALVARYGASFPQELALARQKFQKQLAGERGEAP